MIRIIQQFFHFNSVNTLKLTKSEIEQLCSEIERQWNIHLMTRAVFYSNFSETDKFLSPPFYEKKGYLFEVTLPKIKSEKWKKSAQDVGNWLNQNYVIRLYGILDSKQIRKISPKPEIIKLVESLRPNVGAHSTGNHVSKMTDLRKATRLINSLFNKNIDIQKVENYDLSIDTVLEPMKDKIIDLIKTLNK